jgi:predicted dehydrogenase
MTNVGIVGCGYWGAKHIRNFHELAEANLAVVCDLDEERLQQVRRQYSYVSTSSNVGDLLKDSVDAVVVATPVSSHYRLAREALLHGKHVLVEKPLTASSRQAAELIELAERQDLALMTGHTYEYHPAVDYLRDLVRSGELGDIYYIDADRLNLGLFRSDVNVLWDLAPHDICIVLSLLGLEPSGVSARGSGCIDPTVYDVAYMELRFPGETLAHIHVSWLDPCKVRTITIVGSKKMVIYDDVSDGEKIRIYDKGIAMAANDDGFGPWPPHYRHGDVTIPFISNAEPLKLECDHFLRCIREGERPRSDGWSGLKVVNILEAANKSLVNGGQLEELAPVRDLAETCAAQAAEVTYQ